MLNIFKILILFLGLSYLIVLVGLYAFQRSLLYEPSENNYLDGETLFIDALVYNLYPLGYFLAYNLATLFIYFVAFSF